MTRASPELRSFRKEADTVVSLVAARVAERLAADQEGAAFWRAKYEAVAAELAELRARAAARKRRSRRRRPTATLRDGTQAIATPEPAADPGAKF